MPSTVIGLMRGVGDRITDADDAFLRIVGYTRDDLERGALSWRAMTPPEFMPLDEAGIEQARRAESGGFTVPYQKEFFRQDGSRVPVLLCCAFVPGAPPDTWMGYVVDLSLPGVASLQPDDAGRPLTGVDAAIFHGRLIGELVRERSRLHAIFDSTSSMMWSVDRELRLTSANAAFQTRVSALAGRPLAIGEPVLTDMYPAPVLAEWQAWYAEVLAGTPLVRQTNYGLDTGQRTFAHVLTPYRDAAGVVIGVAGVSHDITALVHAERRAANRERDLLEAQRIARVGSWEWDPHRDVVTWSDTMRDIFGWPYDRPAPTFAEHGLLLTAESWERLQAVVRRSIETASAYEIEAELRAGAPSRYIVARGEPRLGPHGELHGVHGVVMDITERRLAEETRRRLEHQLVQSQKMQALGQLAGGVAHDFNNILTSILLQLGTMREELADQPYLAASVEEVDRAARRASALTQQLLMFSRRQAPDLRITEVNAVVHDFLRMLRRLIGEQYTVEFDACPQPLFVQGDRSMLEQVIMNLVVNARDAMPPGGHVRIATHQGVIADDAVPSWPGAVAGPYVELLVQDTGSGIAPAHRERLFEPFFTTKAPGTGTGLGLATTYGIVSQHGGWIEFDSVVGEGTTFRVRLPQVMAPRTMSPRAADAATLSGDRAQRAFTPATSGAARARILLVEDETALRMLVERTLTQHGYEVVPAADAAQALACWHDLPTFDLVLSDIVLPGERSGVDIMRALRAERPALRGLFMTGYTEAMEQPQFAERLGGRVLRKPFDAATLLEAVEAELRTTD